MLLSLKVQDFMALHRICRTNEIGFSDQLKSDIASAAYNKHLNTLATDLGDSKFS